MLDARIATQIVPAAACLPDVFGLPSPERYLDLQRRLEQAGPDVGMVMEERSAAGQAGAGNRSTPGAVVDEYEAPHRHARTAAHRATP
jgi:hypothetical protein